jgi:diacylglycerol kinase family enzyme
MRITLMHNPEAGDAEHGRKELMAALAKAGHYVTYQSTKKSDYKKALEKRTDLVLAAGGMARLQKWPVDSSTPAFY